jgi:GR25 family glycosyltransferase involved in LPS biosynthesis
MFKFLLLASLPLFGALEDHFRPITGKPLVQQMKNIDFIYMINLDARPEKYARCLREFLPYGIEPFRFSAVNGWQLTFEEMNDVGVTFLPGMSSAGWGTSYLPEDNWEARHGPVQVIGQNYFCHCMSRGAVGIALSQLSILQDAWDAGYETIWVLEDDVEILRSPHLLSGLIEKLDDLVGKENWDILFTDRDTRGNHGQYVPCYGYAWKPNFAPADPSRFASRQDLTEDFRRVGARFGAYSMIVRRSGMRKLLEFLKETKIFLPFDIEYTFPDDIHFYTLNYDIVIPQVGAPSDNGAPNYQ